MITVLIKHRLFIALSIVFAVSAAVRGQQTALDQYIREVLKNSPVLYQNSLDLDKAKISEDIARSYFLPTVGFQLGYQTAAGGRSIDLPVGDMLNGVYSTLNQLTGTSAFPNIQNQQINFLPVNFYDAKIRTNVPVYNPEVKHNIALAGNQIAGAEIEIRLRRRELVRQVKEAYFNYLLALQATKIYREALSLASEGRRVNERLLKNGKGLPAYVLRSEAEIEQINAEIYQSEVQVRNAASWFNFLLNRPADSDIDTLFDESEALLRCDQLVVMQQNTSVREEIKSLMNASAAYGNIISLQKSARLPRLNGILDLGSQSENWRFNSQSRYFLLGLQLDIPIFSAYRIRNKVAQAQLDLIQNESRTAYVRDQINLSAATSINNLKSALESLEAKQKQLEAASTYRRLIDKGYAEGVSTFIETIDARNQWTQAQLSCKIQLYKVLQAGVAVERELALFNIDQ